jgi:carbon monoxide dehydrogenase subunit G
LCEPDDGNRGLLNWDAHRDYVLKSAGYDMAAKLIAERLNRLKEKLSKEEFARCYADCSILILNFSRMR